MMQYDDEYIVHYFSLQGQIPSTRVACLSTRRSPYRKSHSYGKILSSGVACISMRHPIGTLTQIEISSHDKLIKYHMMWHTSTPQHNGNQGSQKQKHHLSKSEEKHDITASYTSTFRDGQKIKISAIEMYITVEFVNHVKRL